MFTRKEILEATLKQGKIMILNNLLESDKWLLRGLVAIYERQTETEQKIGETSESNGVGFTGADANILTSFAEFYLKRGYLSAKQIVIARDKMQKYAGQLMRITREKASVKVG